MRLQMRRLRNCRAEERGREKEICRKEKKMEGQRCIEKTQPPCQRETHSVTQSLALQMLAIGSVNGPHAYSLNPSIVRGLRSSLTVRQSVGVELGSSVLQRSESTVDLCGIQGLSQPNVKVRM